MRYRNTRSSAQRPGRLARSSVVAVVALTVIGLTPCVASAQPTDANETTTTIPTTTTTPATSTTPTIPTPEVPAPAGEGAASEAELSADLSAPATPVDLVALAALETSQRAAAVAAAQRRGDTLLATHSERARVSRVALDAAEASADTAANAELAQRNARDLAAVDAVAAEGRLVWFGAYSYANANGTSVTAMLAQLTSVEGTARVHDALAVSAYLNSAQDLLQARHRAATAKLADAERELRRVSAVSDVAERAATDARQQSEIADLAVVDATATAAWLVADAQQQLFGQSTGVAPDATVTAGGPSVLGRSVVTAEDLASFVTSRGRPHPSIDLVALASAFLDEGAAEGVRGDIAFMQSILETGYFSFRNSMVDVSDYNYAGIGACDSCRTGFGFASMQLGVRAQMQLLHAYADPTLTEAKLAHPRVRTNPDRLSVRGCCDTWMELSGVWATGPGYGQKILGLYSSLLTHAATRRGSAPTS